MKIIHKDEEYSLDSDSVKQYEGERICDTVKALETCALRKKYVLVYSPKLKANILCNKNHLFHASDEYSSAQEKCPNCASNNISNEDAPDNKMLDVSCHDCSYQWSEPCKDN